MGFTSLLLNKADHHYGFDSRVVSRRRARDLRHQGYRPFALHVHSSASHDVPNLVGNHPSSLAQKAKELDMGVVLTDHDTAAGWNEGLIRGNELTMKVDNVGVIHVGVINIPDAQANAELQSLAEDGNLEKVVQRARQMGALAIANHPRMVHEGSLNDEAYWERIIHLGMPVELNSKRPIVENILAYIRARQHQLPVIAASDTHTRGLQSGYTMVKATTGDELVQAIMDNDVYLVPQSAGPLNHAPMAARYMMDIVKAQTRNPDSVEHLIQSSLGGPSKIDFNSDTPLDAILDKLSDGRLMDRPFVRKALEYGIGAATFFAAAGVYIPISNIKSGVRAFRESFDPEMLLPSGEEQDVPEVIEYVTE